MYISATILFAKVGYNNSGHTCTSRPPLKHMGQGWVEGTGQTRIPATWMVTADSTSFRRYSFLFLVLIILMKLHWFEYLISL